MCKMKKLHTAERIRTFIQDYNKQELCRWIHDEMYQNHNWHKYWHMKLWFKERKYLIGLAYGNFLASLRILNRIWFEIGKGIMVFTHKLEFAPHTLFPRSGLRINSNILQCCKLAHYSFNPTQNSLYFLN